MEFSTEKQIYGIGTVIYPADLSSLNKGGEWCSGMPTDREKVRGAVGVGVGLVVCSLPHRIEAEWYGDNSEWFIDVMIPGDDEVYSIFNRNHFTTYEEYGEYMWDSERCHYLGY